jgi:hypothetical protein
MQTVLAEKAIVEKVSSIANTKVKIDDTSSQTVAVAYTI